ncbi:MAG: hypothetical protein R2991_09365 [Thermoanaerobaculia bacterium]
MPPSVQAASFGRWLEERAGSVEQVSPGARTASDFGDPRCEHRALSEVCGLADPAVLETVEVTGEDRRRFLNGYLTCEVAGLEPGQGTYGFFTDGKGRVLADAVVAAAVGRFELRVPRGRRAALIGHLERFVLADRVEIRSRERELLAVVGPRAGKVLRAAGLPAPEAAWGCVEVAEEEILVQRVAHRGAVAYLLAAGAGRGGDWAESLVEAGAVPAGWRALETLRVEAGEPRFGADFDDGNLPQESGLEDAVSYTKGCYLGQEVVARLHYRGRPQRGLVGLEIEADGPPEPGAGLSRGAEEVGRLGSAVRSLRWPPRILGLAVVHRKAAEPGTELVISSGGSARVRALPWTFDGGNP